MHNGLHMHCNCDLLTNRNTLIRYCMLFIPGNLSLQLFAKKLGHDELWTVVV